MDKKYNFPKTFGLMSEEPLSRYTSFRVGGPADLLALPSDRQMLISLLTLAKKEKMPVTIIGGGTNTLVSDKGIRGLVIVLTALKTHPNILEEYSTKTNKTIRVDAGERLSTICQFAMDQELSGLELSAGIPGTLGGAIMMNAGTSTWDISQIVTAVEVVDTKNATYQTIERKNLAFSYRKLSLSNQIIVGAHLTLTQGDPGMIKDTFAQTLKNKKATQPISQPSAGCFFKNPSPDMPAGKLIEDAGLKGVQVNAARISDLHANFIINTDNATCEDILALKRLILKTVFEKYQINLKTEVKVTGE